MAIRITKKGLCSNPEIDPKLTLKAQGVWAQIIGTPDDVKIKTQSIKKRTKSGPVAIYAALRELINAGYIEFKKPKPPIRKSKKT